MNTRKRPGRPPLDQSGPSVSVNLKVPARIYDELYAMAQRERCTIPEVIRRVVREAGDVEKDRE